MYKEKNKTFYNVDTDEPQEVRSIREDKNPPENLLSIKLK